MNYLSIILFAFLPIAASADNFDRSLIREFQYLTAGEKVERVPLAGDVTVSYLGNIFIDECRLFIINKKEYQSGSQKKELVSFTEFYLGYVDLNKTSYTDGEDGGINIVMMKGHSILTDEKLFNAGNHVEISHDQDRKRSRKLNIAFEFEDRVDIFEIVSKAAKYCQNK